MLVLYDMGLFFNSTICVVTFDSRDYFFKVMFSLEVLLQTVNSTVAVRSKWQINNNEGINGTIGYAALSH